VESLIKLKEADLPSIFNTGFQVYHKDHPGPLPSETITGLFGSLFGLSFSNLAYTADNEQPKESIRAIAIAEYTSLFGYDVNYSTYLNGQPDVVIALRRTLSCRTASQIAETTNSLLKLSINERSRLASEESGIDL
jgi:hypothetical protein